MDIISAMNKAMTNNDGDEDINSDNNKDDNDNNGIMIYTF